MYWPDLLDTVERDAFVAGSVIVIVALDGV
jgi:hypothetical protein